MQKETISFPGFFICKSNFLLETTLILKIQYYMAAIAVDKRRHVKARPSIFQRTTPESHSPAQGGHYMVRTMATAASDDS